MNPTTIKTAYEELELTPEEIAEDQGLELGAVKACLKQNSPKFNRGVKSGTEEDISDEEYKQILGAYKQLALYSENDFVRERSLRQLINEKKGRLDKKEITSLKVNVILVNQMIQQTRAAKQAALNPAQEPINV